MDEMSKAKQLADTSIKTVECLFNGSDAIKGERYPIIDTSAQYLLIQLSADKVKWIDKDYFSKY